MPHMHEVRGSSPLSPTNGYLERNGVLTAVNCYRLSTPETYKGAISTERAVFSGALLFFEGGIL